MGEEVEDREAAREEQRFFSKVERYKRNLEYTKGCQQRERQLAQDYSRALWNFSGAGLVLSITLVGMFGVDLCLYRSYLIASWILFVFCILMAMASVRLCHLGYKRQTRAIHKEIYEKKELTTGARCRYIWIAAETFEVVAGVAFLAGIISLLIFVYKNMAP
ncbi:MAG: hypothetical protein JSW34_03065 [Candidatus Zixiibacteriota bacterium]|nr:MAG: hypothetical protein JSW34_03065 [candidate division Zixibacteria bacterium]